MNTEYRSTVNATSDFRGGAEYIIQFFCANRDEWEMINKGQKVRFSGCIKKVFMTTYTKDPGLRYRVNIKVEDVVPLAGSG